MEKFIPQLNAVTHIYVIEIKKATLTPHDKSKKDHVTKTQLKNMFFNYFNIYFTLN